MRWCVWGAGDNKSYYTRYNNDAVNKMLEEAAGETDNAKRARDFTPRSRRSPSTRWRRSRSITRPGSTATARSSRACTLNIGLQFSDRSTRRLSLEDTAARRAPAASRRRAPDVRPNAMTMDRFALPAEAAAPADPGPDRHQPHHLRPAADGARRSGAPDAGAEGESKRRSPSCARATASISRSSCNTSTTAERRRAAISASRSPIARRSATSSCSRIAPTVYLIFYGLVISIAADPGPRDRGGAPSRPLARPPCALLLRRRARHAVLFHRPDADHGLLPEPEAVSGLRLRPNIDRVISGTCSCRRSPSASPSRRS